MDYAFINGTGEGQPLGIINDPALITVDKEDSQAAATITYQNVVNMFFKACSVLFFRRRVTYMSKGRFGIHGGQYIPETLMNAVIELEEAYNHFKNDPTFWRNLTTC